MFSNFKKVYQVLSQKEKTTLFLNVAVFAVSASLLSIIFFLAVTEKTPIAGGRWREGIIGQPVFINPAVSNNDADQEIGRLIFAGLGDLGSIKSEAEGLQWTVRLNEQLFWQDGQEITSDDIIFTIQTILNPESRSPLFQGLEGVIVDRVSELEIKFTLPSPYAFFETTLKNLRPFPRHIWENIPVANFDLSRHTLEPIGSGPYKFASYKKERDGFISEYRLIRNKNFVGKAPYINEIIIKLFPDENELIAAYNQGRIDGFMINNPHALPEIKLRHQVNQLSASRYFAVFINQSLQPEFKKSELRRLLHQITPREKIVEQALKNFGRPINSPFLDFGEKTSLEEKTQEENFETKISLVPQDDQLFTVNLVVPDSPTLIKTAEILRQSWKQAGINLNINTLSPFEIFKAIRKRNYELFLFGNTLSEPQDLYSFWHSRNRFYPGLNLSLYRNSRADLLIEKIRSEPDSEERLSYLQELISIFETNIPAVFLYSSDYLYITSPRLRGFEKDAVVVPADRFDQISSWYVKTGRKLK